MAHIYDFSGYLKQVEHILRERLAPDGAMVDIVRECFIEGAAPEEAAQEVGSWW